MILNRERLHRIEQVNQEALNEAAGRLLPDGWHSSTSIHVLSLALWGLTEAGLHYHPPDRVFPHDEDIESTILHLMECDAENALHWIQGYSADNEGCVEVTLQDDALDGYESPERGAWSLIDEIACGLYEGRPLPRRER